MPPIIAANTVQVRLDWTFTGGYQGKNVLHYLVPGGQPAITPADADSVMGSVSAGFISSALQGQTSSAVSIDSVTLRDVRQQGIPDVISGVAGIGGSAVTNQLPRDVAVVVTLRTALATRRGRGRVYLGGYTTAQVAPGTGRMTTALSDAAAAFLVSLLALTVNGQPWNLGVLSRTDFPMVTRAVVQAITRDLRFDTQRGRDA